MAHNFLSYASQNFGRIARENPARLLVYFNPLKWIETVRNYRNTPTDGIPVSKYMAPLRIAKFLSDEWRQEGDAFRVRAYKNYDQYLEHQKAKTKRVTTRMPVAEKEYWKERADAGRSMFHERFQLCKEITPPAVVLCLGARFGEEVRALMDLGFTAYGIDINPGEKNPYTLYGDFNRTVFPEDYFDVIYSNAFDHLFSLDAVMAEISRVLRPNGTLVLDIVRGNEEGFFPGNSDSFHWRATADLIAQITAFGFETTAARKLPSEYWSQAVFRRCAEDAPSLRDAVGNPLASLLPDRSQ